MRDRVRQNETFNLIGWLSGMIDHKLIECWLTGMSSWFVDEWIDRLIELLIEMKNN